MSETLIETKGLSKHFGGVTAVDGVDFSLSQGELRCLIGPNGAGKSTFFKLLSGQLRPSEGHVVFNGVEIAGKPMAEIARMGMGIKTQVPSVFDDLSAQENIQVAALRKGDVAAAAAYAEDCLSRVGIAFDPETKVGTLSHGQRQLVELAMVLANDPPLVLLDEPAAGMTEQEVANLGQLILSEVADGRAFVVVEHDMKFVRSIARTVTVFNRGRVLAEGDVDQIMANQVVRDVYLGREAV